MHIAHQEIPEGETAADFANITRPIWAVNTTYRIAPLNITTGYTDESSNLSLAFELYWNGATPLRGFFIDGSTGEILLRIPSGFDNTSRIASVLASSPGTRCLCGTSPICSGRCIECPTS